MDDKELEEDCVVWSDLVKEQAAADPELAKSLREFGAIMRQVMAGVKSGQYKTVDDGVFALTGERPKRIEQDDECL